jgi:hypothetical protein
MPNLHARGLTAVGALVSALLVSATAQAEPVQMVVPYHGSLDSDGVPVDGEVQLTFTLYDTAAGPQGAGEPWSECHPQVSVHNGAFAVRLGAPTGPAAVPVDLTGYLGRNRQHYLEISVRRPDRVANPAGDCSEAGGPWTTFGTRQRISPVPQSMTAVLAVPTGAVMHFVLPECPAGWVEFDLARGRYLIGMHPEEALASVVGTALAPGENRAVGQHAHAVTDPGHAHAIRDPGHTHDLISSSSDTPGGRSADGNNADRRNRTELDFTDIEILSAFSGISIQNTGAVPGTPAPGVRLLTCLKE